MQRYLISPIIKDDPVVSNIHLKSQEEPLLSWKEVVTALWQTIENYIERSIIPNTSVETSPNQPAVAQTPV